MSTLKFDSPSPSEVRRHDERDAVLPARRAFEWERWAFIAMAVLVVALIVANWVVTRW